MNMTRKVKREAMKNYNPFKDMLIVLKHYFPDFMKYLMGIYDPRNQGYIKYSQVEFIMISMFSRFSQLESRRHMNDYFNTDNFIKCAKLLFDETLDEIPHGDTINDYFKEVSIDEFRKIMYYMVNQLITMKLLDDYKIENKYYHLIIDGVSMYSSHHQHTQSSLERHHQNGDITYHDDVLVAIISMGNVNVPVDFEMIENIGVQYDKQECEINAAKRLLTRIKKHFKRLNICVSGDALYIGEPMFQLIEEKKWKYLITFKEGCSKEISEYYEASKQGNDVKRYENGEIHYTYYNGVEYGERKLNIIEMEEEGTRFCYATELEITEENYMKIAQHGRDRWKIENKSFNELKNHGYHFTHAWSRDENAMKVNIVISLISLLIMQLLEHYERSKEQFLSIRKLGEDIKEALSHAQLSATDIKDITTSLYVSKVIPY